jgi:glucose-1-phosphate thymidylyltransferase
MTFGPTRRGIILAGGSGTRLHPVTLAVSKQLLPIYDKPMILHPLQKLLNAGIKDVLIISGPEHSGHFLRLLGSGREFKAKFTYEIQDEAGGIAQALGLTEDFAEGGSIAVILGDNIFEDEFADDIKSFKRGAKIFLKRTKDAQRFGVAVIKDNKVALIEEKPKKPKSSYATTGFYLYDSQVFNIIKKLKPSARGELEITDVNNKYIEMGEMEYSIVKGFWSDAGTFDSLLRASTLVKSISKGKNS